MPFLNKRHVRIDIPFLCLRVLVAELFPKIQKNGVEHFQFLNPKQ